VNRFILAADKRKGAYITDLILITAENYSQTVLQVQKLIYIYISYS